MSVDILKKQLKENNLCNLYLIYGEEEYLKKYYLDSIEKKIIQDETMKTLNKSIIEGKADIQRIIDACETLPVFAEKRLVVVKNSGIFKGKAKTSSDDKKSKQKGDGLLEYVQNIPEHVCLVFYEDTIDKRIKMVDAIKKKGLLLELPFQKPVELVKWVIKAFSSYNKQIDASTASLLVENSEQGMNEMLSEIKKLVMYLGDRTKVTAEDIGKVCVKSIKTRIFDLTDAIAEKNRFKAIKLLDDIIIMKEPVQKILYMINRHLRQLLQMKVLIAEGFNTDNAASKIGVTSYAAGKLARQAKGFTLEALKEHIKLSLEYDIAIKTGKVRDRLAAELLITKMSS